MSIDVSTLTVAELEALAVSIQKELKRKKELAKKSLIADMERLAREAGVSLTEIFGDASEKKSAPRAKVAVKYRHPENPDQTWSGRGRQPLWLAALIAEGKALEDLAV